MGKYRHGAARRDQHTKEYRAWASMRRRCELPSQENYHLYGGRGITVHPAWAESFAAFLRDVGPSPSPKHSLDREDPNGNYVPGNVRWATTKEQTNNKRNSVFIEHNGQSKTVAEWAEIVGLKYPTLWARLFVHGWSPERALSQSRRAGPLKSNAPGGARGRRAWPRSKGS